MMLTAVRASECGREFVVRSEKDAISAFMAASRWTGINEREELLALTTLEALIGQETEDCRECNGTGKTMHPAWRLFWAKYGNLKGPEFGAALEENGPEVPEEIACPVCGGTGKVLSERGKRVAEAVRAISDTLPKAKGA